MPFNLYRSDDTDAPVLTSSAGALLDLLEAVLIDGYGSKSPAGWSQPFGRDVNTSVFKFADSAGKPGHYLWVDDPSGYDARVIAYDSMASIDDVSGERFPTESQVSGGLYLRKAATTTSNRPWVCVADAYRFYLIVMAGVSSIELTSSATAFFGFGLGNSYIPDDPYFSFIIGRESSNTSDDVGGYVHNGSTEFKGHYVLRKYSAEIGSTKVCKCSEAPMSLYVMGRSGGPQYPDRCTGNMNCYPVLIREGGPVIRGELPGFFHAAHELPASQLATISGEGDYSGIELIMLPVNYSSYQGRAAFQINGEPI